VKIMSILLLLLLLFPANLSAEEVKIDCQEIREILVEEVHRGTFTWRDVDAIYRRCVRSQQRK